MNLDPNKSKWKAAETLNMDISLKGNENILYLGASSGTTVNELSKSTSGLIFAVEKSINMAIPLIRLSEKRNNIIPLFVDAHDIEYIKSKISNVKIDILFQDIPSIDQVEIIKSASKIVDSNCKILLSLKTFSLSKEEAVINKNIEEIKKSFKILDIKPLNRYHKGHLFFIMKNIP